MPKSLLRDRVSRSVRKSGRSEGLKPRGALTKRHQTIFREAFRQRPPLDIHAPGRSRRGTKRYARARPLLPSREKLSAERTDEGEAGDWPPRPMAGVPLSRVAPQPTLPLKGGGLAGARPQFPALRSQNSRCRGSRARRCAGAPARNRRARRPAARGRAAGGSSWDRRSGR